MIGANTVVADDVKYADHSRTNNNRSSATTYRRRND